MASLSHSPFSDFPNKRSCKEATSPLYPSSNNMQDLYAFMQALHPQMQASPYMHAKPFYYSSNVQGMSKGNGEEDLGSVTTCTSWGNDQASLHQQMEALENKALISGSAEHHVNASKKRIRAIMDPKDVEADGSMKRMKSIGSTEVNMVRNKELRTEANSYAQKAKGNVSSKHDNTEPKSSVVKSIGKASASPIIDADSPSKSDFIHVRARRGQATDSHSLAERVRREKISERMKYLQDLVPGCVKVTGKAMMLDEIINYVQALQRQVEFLSMKLAAVHPSKLEFSLENLFGKKQVAPQPNSVKDGSTLELAPTMQAFAPSVEYQGNVGLGYTMRTTETFCDSMQLHDADASMLQSANQLPCNPAEFLANLPSDLGVNDDAMMHRTAAAHNNTPSATDTMLESAYHSSISQNSQSELDWDDDLQNIVQQMGCFSQISSIFPPHSLSEGLFLQNHMKTEN